jgi:ankyrin repeat protein
VLKIALLALFALGAQAQVAPTPSELAGYTGVFAAAAKGDAATIAKLATRANVNEKDGRGRAPLHVAAFMKQRDAMRALVDAGADPNVLDADRYDMVTIAAVANDPATLEAALKLGNRATNVTSRYDGTALIAAAHLGHVEVVRILIKAGAPLDHVNNLGWTALIESIVLGDGGARHTATLDALVEAGANVNIADRQGLSPLHLAEARGYREMAEILKAAGAR